jgi:hypothetical protein
LIDIIFPMFSAGFRPASIFLSDSCIKNILRFSGVATIIIAIIWFVKDLLRLF